jgi:hypothetical protein
MPHTSDGVITVSRRSGYRLPDPPLGVGLASASCPSAEFDDASCTEASSSPPGEQPIIATKRSAAPIEVASLVVIFLLAVEGMGVPVIRQAPATDQNTEEHFWLL